MRRTGHKRRPKPVRWTKDSYREYINGPIWAQVKAAFWATKPPTSFLGNESRT